jgi:hypothetical protein
LYQIGGGTSVESGKSEESGRGGRTEWGEEGTEGSERSLSNVNTLPFSELYPITHTTSTQCMEVKERSGEGGCRVEAVGGVGGMSNGIKLGKEKSVYIRGRSLFGGILV